MKSYQYQKGVILEDVMRAMLQERRLDYTESSQKQDRFEGIDGFISRVPFDICLSIDKKARHLTGKKHMIDCGMCKVYFYIRTGNGYKKFEQPVVVLHVDTLIDITELSAYSIIDAMIDANVLGDELIDYYLDNTYEE